MDRKDVRSAAEYLRLPQKRLKSEFLKKKHDMWYIDVEEGNPCPFLTLEGCQFMKQSLCNAEHILFGEKILKRRGIEN